MFSSQNNSTSDYNFFNNENISKWKKLFLSSLHKVLQQVHPSLTAKDDALECVENHILHLLESLIAKPQPHSIQDVEERVLRTFPNPIDRWAVKDAQSAIEKGRKKPNLVLPVDKVHSLLQKEVLQYKLDYQVSVYIVAVLEYISADILKLAGNYVKKTHHMEISCQDIKVSMWADKVLIDMFYYHECDIAAGDDEPALEQATSYEDVVKQFMSTEKQYLRELHLIIKVFREQISKCFAQHEDLDEIFSCIIDIAELTTTLIGSLEDTLEMTDEKQLLCVGICFEELSEDAEFDVYDKYSKDILHDSCHLKLEKIVCNSDVALALQSSGQGFREAVRYVLPKLLLNPIYHAFTYFDYIKALQKLSPSPEDRKNLEQIEGLLRPLQVELERVLKETGHGIRRKSGDICLYTQGRRKTQNALPKLGELQKLIDNYESKDMLQFCNEFIFEGTLGKVSQGRRLTERYAFLFDGLMILCKPSARRSSVTGTSGEYRLKEKFFLRKVEILDREDTDDLQNSFEVAPRLQPHVILFAKNSEEKATWMAALVMLSTLDEEKKNPLVLPSSQIYPFSEEDSSSNIVLEERTNSTNVPLIKGATILKLIERLTYHMYADPLLVRTFLTTYRSFCSPSELLSLLIERFEIPDLIFLESTDSNIQREMSKKFRRDYVQPVQFRHWVDQHFYDFEQDSQLINKLIEFLSLVKGKSMRKWVESINKIIQRRRECGNEQHEIIFGQNCSPPPVEWHISYKLEEFDLMTLHPLELARQMTLLESDFFRAVKPSELVGSVWMKKEKQQTSPNLLRMIHHTNNVTRWYQKCIVDTENFEERIAVMSRIIEIMLALQELNNFNGVLSVVSAMGSAAVHRLTFTSEALPCRYQKSLEEARQLNNHHFKKYCEKLRSINPPCVPFFGMYLTNILHIEEGNPDFLERNGQNMINFSKRRKVAEITEEIQQYQNQPYFLSIEPRIRQFLENLDPFPNYDETEIGNYLYAQSLKIEPRHCKQPPKFQRSWPDKALKSPGIKSRTNKNNANPLAPLGDLFTYTKLGNSDEKEESMSTSPQGISPSPSTPATPLHISGSDNSIFATIVIGSTTNTVTSSPVIGTKSQKNYPPPLPPRRKRDISEVNFPQQIKQAEIPPPLPPRCINITRIPFAARTPAYELAIKENKNEMLSVLQTNDPAYSPKLSCGNNVQNSSIFVYPEPNQQSDPPPTMPRGDKHCENARFPFNKFIIGPELPPKPPHLTFPKVKW